jgi:hypothetical protein
MRERGGREKGGEAGRFHGGTPGYSAPEQLEGGASGPSPSFDVYSLGALAYALLTGKGPFSSYRGIERLRAQRKAALAPASSLAPSLPPGVDAELARALSPDPLARHGGVSELVDALERTLSGALGSASLRPSSEPMSVGRAFILARSATLSLRGERAHQGALQSLPQPQRETFVHATDPREHYPASALVAYLSAAFGGDREALGQAGFDSCSAAMTDVLDDLQIERTPLALVRALQPLVHRLHAWGKLSFASLSSAEAEVTIKMPEGFAPTMCSVFGGALRALVALASRSVDVEHVACVAKGDEVCRIRARWRA